MNNAANIWGSKTVSGIELALVEQIEIESVLAALAASRANKFRGADVVAVAGVAVVEYDEKQFTGPAMADDEWATI